MDAVALMGKIIKKTAYLTRDNESIGCAKLVVFANVPEDNPFMAGAFHGVGQPDVVINVGVSGPGVVRAALAKSKDLDIIETALHEYENHLTTLSAYIERTVNEVLTEQGERHTER